METMTMDTMTTATTTPWLALSSYGTAACVAPVVVSLHGTRGCIGSVAEIDLLVPMAPEVIGFSGAHSRDFAPRNKDVRPGSRAWSPPV